jgi:hypothetical protein
MPNYSVLPAPIYLPNSPSNSYVGMQQKVNPQSTDFATPIVMPATPIITLGAVGNSTITINVINHAANSSLLRSYIVYVNDARYGNFVAISNAIKISGLPNNREYRIKIKSEAAIYTSLLAGGTISRYSETSFSNEVSGTPSITLAARSSPSMNTNKVDIKYVSSNTFANSSLVATSQYSELYEGETYLTDPVYFRNNFLVGSFNANIKFKARVQLGGNDKLYGGEVFGIFSDVKIDLNPLPFSNLLSYDNDTGETVAQKYDETWLELWQAAGEPFPSPLFATAAGDSQQGIDHFNVDIGSQLKREFILARPYIAEKLRKCIKNNFGTIIRSADTMRAYLDVTNFNTPGISTSFKDFMLPYEGLVFITPHIIASTFPAGVNETTTFSYKMVDSNNVTQFTKENVSASIVLAPTQTADSFTFQELKPIQDQSDIFGPTSDELAEGNIIT